MVLTIKEKIDICNWLEKKKSKLSEDSVIGSSTYIQHSKQNEELLKIVFSF